MGSVHFNSFGRQGLIVATSLLVLSLCCVVTVLPYGRAFFDLFTLLDGAYRISVGQMPHVDFASPIGPLPLFVMRAGQVLFPNGNSFVTYHGVMLVLFVPAVILLASRFLSNRSFLAAFGIFLIVMLLPMTLDDTHLSEISYFASYNRFASALLFLLGLWYVLPKRRFDAVLVAFLLFLLIFVKITAAIVGAGIVIAALILGRVSWRVGMEAFALLIGALLALELASGLVTGYHTDIGTMIALNESTGLYALFYYAFNNWLVLGLTGVLAIATAWSFFAENYATRLGLVDFVVDFWKEQAFILDVLLLVVAAWVAESQNTGNLGLIAAAAIFFHPAAWRDCRFINGLLLAAMLFPVADMALKRSLRAVMREQVAATEQPVEIFAKGTRVPLPTYEGARFFGEILRDKIALAREVQAKRFFLTHDPVYNAPAAQLAFFMDTKKAIETFQQKGYGDLANRYASLVFSDPFARILKLIPARHTMLTMDADRTVPRFSAAEARRYLRDADGVFVSHCNMIGERFDLMFEPVLKADFSTYPLSLCWSFHVRKKRASLN